MDRFDDRQFRYAESRRRVRDDDAEPRRCIECEKLLSPRQGLLCDACKDEEDKRHANKDQV